MKKAVILLSGGLDSTTCLALANAEGYECHALSFNYQQRHITELNAAKKIAEHFKVKNHQIIDLPIHQLGHSALTDPAIPVPNYSGTMDIPSTYVPARNTIFLSFAIGFAEVVKAHDIFIGVSAIDYSHYPDCRPEYYRAFEIFASLATKEGVNGNPVRIHTPIIYLSKAQTIHLGLALGVDYRMTVSCYQANDEGLACGSCDSCHLRKKGFTEANVEDLTRYY